MEKKLYLITNSGCDDCTRGLVRFSNEELAQFKHLVEQLNKNSTYGCQPIIHVTRIPEDFLEEYCPDGEEKEYEDFGLLYLDDKIYTINYQSYYERCSEVEEVL